MADRESKRRRVFSDPCTSCTSISSFHQLLYKDVCILCNKKLTLYEKHPGMNETVNQQYIFFKKLFYFITGRMRKKYRVIATLEIKDTLIKAAEKRQDDWGMEVHGRLAGIIDLVAEEAKYHLKCKLAFGRDATTEVRILNISKKSTITKLFIS